MTTWKLMEFIQEGRSKPALAAAKFTLVAALDEQSYHDLSTLASEMLQLLSEIDDPSTSFKDVYNILSSIRPNDEYYPQVKLSTYLYKLRTGIINDDELDDCLGGSFGNGTKELICKSISSLYVERFGDAFNFILEAINKDVYTARSMLCAFEKTILDSFRRDLVEAREKRLIPCSCNSGIQNYGFRNSIVHAVKTTYASCENLAETSFITDIMNANNNQTKQTLQQQQSVFQLCKLHRVITELDDVIRIVEMAEWDRTAILNSFIDAGRLEYAVKYYDLNTKSISTNKIKHLEKLVSLSAEKNGLKS